MYPPPHVQVKDGALLPRRLNATTPPPTGRISNTSLAHIASITLHAVTTKNTVIYEFAFPSTAPIPFFFSPPTPLKPEYALVFLFCPSYFYELQTSRLFWRRIFLHSSPPCHAAFDPLHPIQMELTTCLSYHAKRADS